MVSVSVGTSPKSMRATTVLLDTSFGYNISHCLALPFILKLYVCPEYKVSLAEDINRTFLLILSANISRILLGSAIYKTIILATDKLNVERLNGT